MEEEQEVNHSIEAPSLKPAPEASRRNRIASRWVVEQRDIGDHLYRPYVVVLGYSPALEMIVL